VDEKDLIGSYSSDITLQNEVARLVFRRRLDVRKLVTHTFPLSRREGDSAGRASDNGVAEIVVTQGGR